MLLHMMPIWKCFFQIMSWLVTIHVKFHASLFCVLLGFNFFPGNIFGLRFMFNFFILNYLTFSLSKLPTQLSIFLLNKQPLEELLKIGTVFFWGSIYWEFFFSWVAGFYSMVLLITQPFCWGFDYNYLFSLC